MEAEFLMGGYYGGATTGFLPAEKRLSDQRSGGDHNHNFMVDDLLDFSNDMNTGHDGDDHDAMVTDGFLNIDADITKNSYDHSSAALTAANTTTDSCNSSSGYGHSLADSHFSNELCVPYDDMAELEWLSNFVEDSFSTDQNLQTNLHILTGSKPTTPESSSSETHLEPTTRNPTNQIFQPEGPRPGKARSKRSRVAPCDWSTRLLHLSPTTKPSSKKQEKPNPNNSDSGSEGVVRRCLHCASEKTPQWRTGPMGPKTLCNACGVRYKSGRLVPEYRPAASPTFVSAKHSNSHRKVVELRRQKEMQRGRQEQFLSQSSIFGVSNGAEDFLFHHQSGPNNFTHLI